MPLLINIGNTSAQFVFADGRQVVIPTTELASGRFPDGIGQWPAFWLVSSVVPDLKSTLDGLAIAHNSQIHWLSYKDLTGVDCSRVDMTTIGSDRIANIAAAVKTLDLPAMVIDCGTAITTEIVMPGPSFLGGAILPGRLMQRQALAQFTGLLPVVPLSQARPAAVGTSTEAAIMAGIDTGTLGSLERLICSTLADLHVDAATIVATGGDADFFIQHSPGIQRAPHPFTILGMRAIAERLQWPSHYA